MTPTPRQAEFLQLDCEEALFGGAAGGAKSEALLMWLAEGVKYPEYGGLVFRRTRTQLMRRDGLVDKSKRIYPHLGGVYNASKFRWSFPSGATIELGNLPVTGSIDDYQGPSWHRIAFDELTQFPESHYLFLIGRLRRNPNFPLRPGMRAASNPGGMGHLWVRERFVSDEAMRVMSGRSYRDPSPPGEIFWKTTDRAFVPSRLADNPYLDFDDYVQKLMHLDPVTRERMLAGDWAVRDDARFDPAWFREWAPHFANYHLFGADGVPRVVDPKATQKFITVDAAATSKEIRKLTRLGRRSRSVISIWARVLQTQELIWLDARYGYWEFGRLCEEALASLEEHKATFIAIEDEKTGRALASVLEQKGRRNVRLLSHGGKDKLARAQPFIRHCELGKVFLPQARPEWRHHAEGEMLSWTGDEDEPADFIDTASYAALSLGVQKPRVWEF